MGNFKCNVLDGLQFSPRILTEEIPGQIYFPVVASPDMSVFIVLSQDERGEAALYALEQAMSSVRKDVRVFVLCDDCGPGNSTLIENCGATIIRVAKGQTLADAINQAVEMASGSDLVFLDSNVQLHPDAISAIGRQQVQGTMGARIVGQDGALQQAGGIIWSDGSCVSYGLGERADSSEYMFQRDVDFCSAGFLATRKDCFGEHGGFDDRFETIGFAMVDYCVRLAKSGCRTVYCPEVVAVNRQCRPESAQSANDETKFANKHFQHFSTKPTRIETTVSVARLTDQSQLRLLFVDDLIPHDHLGAGFPRTKQIIETLANVPAQVTYWATGRIDETWDSIRRAIPANIEVVQTAGLSLEAHIADRESYYDAIWVSRPHNMKAITEWLPQKCRRSHFPLIIYDSEALYSQRSVVMHSVFGQPMAQQEAEQLIEEELSLTHQADHILAVSDADRETLRGRSPAMVSTLGHYLEPVVGEAPFENRRDVLFMGAFHGEKAPNTDSINWFCDEVLPRIQQKLGLDLRLKVIGLNKTNSIMSRDGNQLDLYGQVDDPAPYFNNARVFVAPTRYAAGIPLKVHHAASYGVPIVATEILARQLGWQDGRDLLANSDPEVFANNVVRLYQDRDLWSSVREAGLNRLTEDCSKARFVHTIDGLLSDIRERRQLRQSL